ncbi:lanthionine synthetase LanC family protein [Flavitalea sp. BT771]|uniref:lanthionine synthetase LanC family protein n=1 Tax=Flavitalea sp. BT771 TaxID=3063329 RepID=UPI0026E12607|nr:lanthionine synthetase LanC family protein [Flavitalea sp. BT771]MDO6434787.1 lanthionine synthetase LanC family protein [Flavitalea sp. BT771]MDV6223687.1 lanthionine synthetase LanC family protein [Flavitalea sp. BT771]
MIKSEPGLKDLANYFLLNSSFGSDNSLQSGKLAIAVFFFYAKRNDLDVSPPDAGYSYLEEINSGRSFTSIFYSTGLLGYAVVLDHLLQLGFAEGGVNQYLKDLESHVLPHLPFPNWQQVNIANGLSGPGLYLLHRLSDPTLRTGPLKDLYREKLNSCLKEIKKLLDPHPERACLPYAEPSIWNGWTGVLVFLNKIKRMGLSDEHTENIARNITNELMNYVKSDPSFWPKTEAFFGLFYAIDIDRDKTLHDEIFESFVSFIDSGYNNLQQVEFVHAAFIALLIDLLGRKYRYDNAIALSRKITDKVKMMIAENKIPALFGCVPASQTIEMGMYRGAGLTALSLLSLQSGDCNWLKILGIWPH